MKWGMPDQDSKFEIPDFKFGYWKSQAQYHKG